MANRSGDVHRLAPLVSFHELKNTLLQSAERSAGFNIRAGNGHLLGLPPNDQHLLQLLNTTNFLHFAMPGKASFRFRYSCSC